MCSPTQVGFEWNRDEQFGRKLEGVEKGVEKHRTHKSTRKNLSTLNGLRVGGSFKRDLTVIMWCRNRNRAMVHHKKV